MTLSKESLSDEDWSRIDFDLIKVPRFSRPVRPPDWVVDRELGVVVLPATDHYYARDGTQRFLLIDNSRAIWLYFGRHPPSPIQWSLWAGATADEIQHTNTIIEKALSVYFGDSFKEQRPIVEFEVSDPFHVETFEELVQRFNRTTEAAVACARLRYPRVPNRDAKRKESILHTANQCFSEDQRMRLLNHFGNGGNPRFGPEAVTTLVWLSESHSLLHRLRSLWRQLVA